MDIPATDFEFLRRTASLYEALTHSAVDPVVVDDIVEIGRRRERVPMFYDAFGDGGTDDVTHAESIVKKRISSYPEDIHNHYAYHKKFLALASSINDSIRKNNRIEVSENVERLCTEVRNYDRQIVQRHRSYRGKDSFLYSPSCQRSFAFHIPHSNFIGDLSFNPEASSDWIEIGLNEIIGYAQDFSIMSTKIPLTTIETQPYSGESIMDTSLLGRLALNKELLKRLEFDVEGK